MLDFGRLGYNAGMIKKILILGKTRDQPDEGPLRFAELLGAHTSSEFIGAFYEDVLFVCEGSLVSITISGRNIDEYDAIVFTEWFKASLYYEDIVFALASYAQAKGMQYYNTEAIARSKSKLSEYVLFALNDLPYPKTVYARNPATLLEQAKKQLAYPFIVKTTVGSRGDANYLVTNETVEQELLEDMIAFDRPFCAQEFIPNEGDLRVLVFNNQIAMAIYRQAQAGTHLNNTSQGSTATLYDLASLPEDAERIILTAAKSVRRQICGVDIMFSKEGLPYLLEVNNMPQLTTGSFVAEKMQALAKALTQ